MNKLSKTQKNNLVAIAIGTVCAMVGLWYFVVVAKQQELAENRQKSADLKETLNRAEMLVRQHEDEIALEAHDRSELLAKREATLAPDRDTYAWMVVNTINPFIQSRKGVSIYQVSPAEISDSGLFPKFPYRWATFKIKGVGYFQDFGKFFADFENNFPYFRIQNLEIFTTSGGSFDPEKLSFNFEIVAPVIAAGGGDNK